MATTLLTGLPFFDFGDLTQAKSRAGSHISVTADGRYPAARETSDVLTFCDVRRMMDMKPALRGRSDSGLSRLALEEGSRDEGLELRSRASRRPVAMDGVEAEPMSPLGSKPGTSFWGERRKM